ncbi:MAG: hypothetical protein O3A13_06625 [Proteobacteria bacterium]|nr:hypothetical protein [Pseudomonadota bacterium]MDA0993292.1 hypothetical protein [Pseudomonadota bacterium]
MRQRTRQPDGERDWRISATLGAVWIAALTMVYFSGMEIPASMLLVATVFFVLLIPAMNDLVRTIERVSGGCHESQEQSRGRNHDS